jgi:hypothetical protein
MKKKSQDKVTGYKVTILIGQKVTINIFNLEKPLGQNNHY